MCKNTSCAAKQSAEILAKFLLGSFPANHHAYPVVCQGQCSIAPTIRIVPNETWYCRLTPKDAPAICDALREDTVVEEKLNHRIHCYSHYQPAGWAVCNYSKVE